MTLISRQYIDDHDFVARYLADQLSDAERERFEAYYLEHPEMLQELNRTAQFKSGLMDLQESGALEKILKQRPWWQRTSRLAVAAAIMFAIIGAGIWFNWQRASQPILASSVTALTHRFQPTLPIAGSFNIQRTRTSSYDARINLPKRAAAIELRVKPEVSAIPARYQVNLARVSADNSLTKIAEISALGSGIDGFVAIYLNAAGLSPAVYEIRLIGDIDTNATKVESSFLVEVLAASDR
jgi:hypothetical protein